MIGAPDRALPLIEDVVDFATALVCAEAVGAIKSANDATLEYLKTRKQFGVRDRIVPGAAAPDGRPRDRVRAGEIDGAASPARPSIPSMTPQRRSRTVSAAKCRIADACRRVSQESIQLHGGMGMSDEVKVSHTFRRLTAIAQQFGDADHHLERFAVRFPTSRLDFQPFLRTAWLARSAPASPSNTMRPCPITYSRCEMASAIVSFCSISSIATPRAAI